RTPDGSGVYRSGFRLDRGQRSALQSRLSSSERVRQEAWMHFPLTAEQEAVRAHARALADREFRERAARWDEREEYPWENVKQLVEAGLRGMTVPAAYGGQGRTLHDVILAIEQVARVCGVTGRILVD